MGDHDSTRWNDDVGGSSWEAGGGDSWDRSSDRWNNDARGDNSWVVGEGNSWDHGSGRWNDGLIGGDRWNDDFGYNDAADILSDGINTLANVFGLSSRRNQVSGGWHARDADEGNFYRMNDDEDWASPSSSERERQSGDIGAWERELTSWKPRRRRPGQEPLFRQRRAAKEQSSTDGNGTTPTTSNNSGGGKRKRRGTNV